MSLPILGNQYFNQVENVASSQVQRIFTDNVVTTNLKLGNSFAKLSKGVTEFYVVGFTPASFINNTTVAVASGVPAAQSACVYFNLLNASGNTIVLPTGAVITDLYFINNGLAITKVNAVGVGGSVVFDVGGATLNKVTDFPTVASGLSPLALTAGTLANMNAFLIYRNTATGASFSSVAANNLLTLDVFLTSPATALGSTGFLATGGLTVYCTYRVFSNSS